MIRYRYLVSMKTAIIIHGMPSKAEYLSLKNPSQSNRHWMPWLQKQLVIRGVLAQTPEMPEPYRPVYKKYCSVFERFKIDKDTMLVGHSLGAGFLVRWLSEHKVKVGKVALVAPWLDPYGGLTTGMLDFRLDENLAKRTQGITIFTSSDDDPDVLQSASYLKKSLKGRNVKVRKFTNRGHFTLGDMGTEKFPELRDELLK